MGQVLSEFVTINSDTKVWFLRRSSKMGELKSESVFGQFGGEFFELFAVGCLSSGVNLLFLQFIELLGLGLSLLFKTFNEALFGPSGELGKISKDTELSVVSQSNNLKSVWDNHSLFVIIWEGDTFEDLQTSESCGTLRGFMGEHSSDGSPEHTGWGLVMFETSSWVGVDLLVQEFVPLELVSEERSRFHEEFTSDYSDSLTIQEFLCDL